MRFSGDAKHKNKKAGANDASTQAMAYIERAQPVLQARGIQQPREQDSFNNSRNSSRKRCTITSTRRPIRPNGEAQAPSNLKRKRRTCSSRSSCLSVVLPISTRPRTPSAIHHGNDPCTKTLRTIIKMHIHVARKTSSASRDRSKTASSAATCGKGRLGGAWSDYQLKNVRHT